MMVSFESQPVKQKVFSMNIHVESEGAAVL